jgi:hypothetical protein
MQSDDLSNKKSNNKQTTNEGLSGNNSPEDPATGASILKEEEVKLTPVEMKTGAKSP